MIQARRVEKRFMRAPVSVDRPTVRRRVVGAAAHGEVELFERWRAGLDPREPDADVDERGDDLGHAVGVVEADDRAVHRSYESTPGMARTWSSWVGSSASNATVTEFQSRRTSSRGEPDARV